MIVDRARVRKSTESEQEGLGGDIIYSFLDFLTSVVEFLCVLIGIF